MKIFPQPLHYLLPFLPTNQKFQVERMQLFKLLLSPQKPKHWMLLVELTQAHSICYRPWIFHLLKSLLRSHKWLHWFAWQASQLPQEEATKFHHFQQYKRDEGDTVETCISFRPSDMRNCLHVHYCILLNLSVKIQIDRQIPHIEVVSI